MDGRKIQKEGGGKINKIVGRRKMKRERGKCRNSVEKDRLL